MKIEELKQRPKEELTKLTADCREKLRSLKFDLAGGKTKNVKEIRGLKKDIARILTFLNK
jgi:ribosomal protein L29